MLEERTILTSKHTQSTRHAYNIAAGSADDGVLVVVFKDCAVILASQTLRALEPINTLSEDLMS
jgi:hypothetical protein